MSENEVRKDDDDEISLVDLFVVLLKYRRLIIVFAILGLVVSAAYYVVQTVSGGRVSFTGTEVARNYEGRMSVVINPRLGRSGTDRFPAWFGSRELLETALKEAGLAGWTYDSFIITYNQNDGVDIVLKPGEADEERIEKLFSVLLSGAESMAAAYYAGYAEDMVSYFESLRDSGKDYSARDYTRYRWARDLLAGDDTVLKVLYPPLITGGFSAVSGSSGGVSSGIVLVIFFAFLFFAVFLAFVLNAIKNISGDSEVIAKIRGALGKGDNV